MSIRLVTFSLWLAVGASAVAWFLPWLNTAPADPSLAPAPVAAEAPVQAADWSSVLARKPSGPAQATAPSDASRFRLVGVAGPARASSQGVALLSIDGKPAQAYRPGEAVDGPRVVLEVTAHTVKIGLPGGPANLVLQAPLLPAPATGVPAGLVNNPS